MPLDFLRGDKILLLCLWDVSLEVGVANHLGEIRASSRMAQEGLGEEDDKL